MSTQTIYDTLNQYSYRVVSKKLLTDEVIKLELMPVDAPGMAFIAGQYIEILLENTQYNYFSLAGMPQADGRIELHVRYYAGGAFSEYAFATLKEGDTIQLQGPMGKFYFRKESPRPAMLVAGGTGFAPIKAIIEQMITDGVDRDLYLYWGARGEADLYLHDMAVQWAHDDHLIHYVPVLSEVKEGDNWQGRTGLVHQAVIEDFDDVSSFDVYACGPPAMTKAVCVSFVEHGLPMDQAYSDTFEFRDDEETSEA